MGEGREGVERTFLVSCATNASGLFFYFLQSILVAIGSGQQHLSGGGAFGYRHSHLFDVPHYEEHGFSRFMIRTAGWVIQEEFKISRAGKGGVTSSFRNLMGRVRSGQKKSNITGRLKPS